MIFDVVDFVNSCDYIVVVIGFSDEWESEGYDRKNFVFFGNQNEFVMVFFKDSRNFYNVIIVN